METLYDANGRRKYLTKDERAAFLKAAERASREVRTFCGMLAYTGCRISEALQLTADRVDLAQGVIVFESLKSAGRVSTAPYRCPGLPRRARPRPRHPPGPGKERRREARAAVDVGAHVGMGTGQGSDEGLPG